MKNLFLLLLLLPIMAISQDADSQIMTMRQFTVKHGHVSQFVEGMKMWKECYLENGGTNEWNAWRRVNGEGSVFIMTGTAANWAEFDKTGPVGTSCRHIIQNFIDPHVVSVSYNMANTMPQWSRKTPLEGRTKVNVTYFKTNNTVEFNAVIEEILNSLRKAEGETRGAWYRTFGGGPDIADYFVSIPYLNYAGMDNMGPNVWTTYEKEHGKKKTDELRARWRACLTDSWSYMFTLNKEISNIK
jgi:hypothetical protein